MTSSSCMRLLSPLLLQHINTTIVESDVEQLTTYDGVHRIEISKERLMPSWSGHEVLKKVVAGGSGRKARSRVPGTSRRTCLPLSIDDDDKCW